MAGSAVGVAPFVLAPGMAQIGIPASLATTAALGGLAVLTFLVIGRLLATAGTRPHVVNA
jgi:hypothetical protein